MFTPMEEKGLKSWKSPPEIIDILEEDEEEEEKVNWDDDNEVIPLGWKVGERKRDKKTVFQSPSGSVLVGMASAFAVMNSQNHSEDDIQRLTTYLLNNRRGRTSRDIISIDLEDDAMNVNTGPGETTRSLSVMNKRKSEDLLTINKKVK